MQQVHLGHTVLADGRWRLFVFAEANADESTDHPSRMRALCEFLERSPKSPVQRYTPADDDVDSVIEVIAIYQQAHRELSISGLPAILLPRKGRLRLVDYEKVYCAGRKRGQDIFHSRGIDRRRGALIVVRPDQYVAHVLPLDAHRELADFFAGFMLNAA